MWRPLGCLLVEMESSGFQIDRSFLSQKEAESKQRRQAQMERVRQWVAGRTQDDAAKLINFQSKQQMAFLFFGDDGDEVEVKVPAAARRLDPKLPATFLLPVRRGPF